MKIYSDCIDP